MGIKVVRQYVVTQERQVRVSATSLEEAATKSASIFNDPIAIDEGKVRETDLIIRED